MSERTWTIYRHCDVFPRVSASISPHNGRCPAVLDSCYCLFLMQCRNLHNVLALRQCGLRHVAARCGTLRQAAAKGRNRRCERNMTSRVCRVLSWKKQRPCTLHDCLGVFPAQC